MAGEQVDEEVLTSPSRGCARPGWHRQPSSSGVRVLAPGTQNCTGVSPAGAGWRPRRSTGYCSTTKTASRSPPGGLLLEEPLAPLAPLEFCSWARAPAAGAWRCAPCRPGSGDLRAGHQRVVHPDVGVTAQGTAEATVSQCRKAW